MKPLFSDETSTTVATPAAPAPLFNSVSEANLPVPAQSTAVNVQPHVTPVAITDQEIDNLGLAASQKLAPVTQKMLASVRASDADAFGDKLNSLISTAKGMDPEQMKGGLLAKVTHMFGSAKERVLAQYSTVEKRMDALVAELRASVTRFSGQVPELEQMYQLNLDAHRQFEADVARAEQGLAWLNQQLAEQQQATDAFAAQNVMDIRNRIARLERKIDDLKRRMLLAKQAAPQIRLTQENARGLAEKFKEAEEVLIPAYKNIFTMYLMQQAQKKGAQLANTMHDAIDEAFTKQADQLRENTQLIATARERAVVSTETLMHSQQQLLGAFDDMFKIAEEGRRARKEAEPQLKAMEQELISYFAPKHA